MKKKADMSIQTVVIAVLALMVLVVVLFIFWKNVGGAGTQFTWFRTHAGEEWCAGAGMNRYCTSSSECTEKGGSVVSNPYFCKRYKSADKTECAEQGYQDYFTDCGPIDSKICCQKD